MNHKHIHSILLLLAALCLGASSSLAQTVKNITVSNERSYTDHVSLAEDSRDMDVMIKFIFNEQQNVLTVSLISYRRLFVFQEDTRYCHVIRGRRFHPEKLPYVADVDGRFTVSSSFRRSVPYPHRKYVFNRWISYEGLQPIPAEYKIVNDFIEQAFDIKGNRSYVSVNLRDIFLIDAIDNHSGHYEISKGRNLNTQYQIAIVRNPCHGKEEELKTANNALKDITKAYNGFHNNYPNGEVSTAEALKDFQETQNILLTQFPRKEELSTCPDIEAALKQYNQYVDSIGILKCKLVVPQDASWDDGKPLDVQLLYTQTRQLDKALARWLVSKDELEKKDLVTQCLDIISDVSAMIRQHKVSTPEEQKAVQAYKQAEQYFRKTCKQ